MLIQGRDKTVPVPPGRDKEVVLLERDRIFFLMPSDQPWMNPKNSHFLLANITRKRRNTLKAEAAEDHASKEQRAEVKVTLQERVSLQEQLFDVLVPHVVHEGDR